MRKDREQQKKGVYKQLNLFISTPYGQTDGSTERAVRHGVELSSRSENQRSLTTNALEEIVRYENLTRAYQHVRKNGGGSGVDGMSVRGLNVWLGDHMDGFRRSLWKSIIKSILFVKKTSANPTVVHACWEYLR